MMEHVIERAVAVTSDAALESRWADLAPPPRGVVRGWFSRRCEDCGMRKPLVTAYCDDCAERHEL
jgi:hypothetical protein